MNFKTMSKKGNCAVICLLKFTTCQKKIQSDKEQYSFKTNTYPKTISIEVCE